MAACPCLTEQFAVQVQNMKVMVDRDLVLCVRFSFLCSVACFCHGYVQLVGVPMGAGFMLLYAVL